VASIGAFLRLTGQQQQGGITLEDLQRMTPAEVQAFLIQTASPQEAPPEPVPQGVRPDFGLSTVSGIGQTAKSPYERTLRPGEARSAEDLQDMLAEVILAAGSGAVPGIGPHKLPRQNPGSRTRPSGGVWGMTREQFLGNPQITSNANARDLQPKLTKPAALAPPEPFVGGLTIRRGERSSVVLDGETPVASYDGDTLVVARPYRRRGIATELVYDYRTRNPDIPPAAQRTKTAQRIQEKVWERIARERFWGRGNQSDEVGE
jgi:hypothetical protein